MNIVNWNSISVEESLYSFENDQYKLERFENEVVMTVKPVVYKLSPETPIDEGDPLKTVHQILKLKVFYEVCCSCNTSKERADVRFKTQVSNLQQ